MPLYEFQCPECGKRATLLLSQSEREAPQPCPKCAHQMAKRVSRFARARSEDDKLDEIADRLELAGEPESPSQMREFSREIGYALDEGCADEMEELMEEDAGTDNMVSDA